MRFLLVMLLAMAGSAAEAEWLKVRSATASGGADSYADPATISRNGDMVKMWHVYDYQTTHVIMGKAHLSAKSLNEYDCKSEKVRTLSFSWHSGKMATGETVHSGDDSPTNWISVHPGSTVKGLWTVACAKR
jgi:hypothetical protein